MKTLYILRHAKSACAHLGQKDYDRALDEQGARDAAAVGARMRAQGMQPELVVSSSALRAVNTAIIVCTALQIAPDAIVQERKIYLAGSPKLQQLISFFDEEASSALLVAHNPALTDLVNDLAHAAIDHIPPAGLVCIELAIDYWAQLLPGVGKVLHIDFPKYMD